MNVMPVKMYTPKFRGMLNISGPDKNFNVSVNTDNISTVNPTTYYNHLNRFKQTEGSIIRMNNGSSIYTYLPHAQVIEACALAKKEGKADLATPFNPLLDVQKGLLS